MTSCPYCNSRRTRIIEEDLLQVVYMCENKKCKKKFKKKTDLGNGADLLKPAIQVARLGLYLFGIVEDIDDLFDN